MNIQQYDKIWLKDGRHGTVVEILGDGQEYIVDVDLPGPNWDTISVSPADIYGPYGQQDE